VHELRRNRRPSHPTCARLHTELEGGTAAQPEHFPYVERWDASGECVYAAHTLRSDDDDWSQAGALVRRVMDDASRDRLVSNVVGHLSDGVSPLVLERAVQYWRNIDAETGERIAETLARNPRP
jgi:catalase